MLFLTLDNLATRYHCLPSEALSRANTLDLYVLDVSAKWAKYQSELAEGKTPATSRSKPSQEQMLEMIKKVKERSK